MAKPVDAIEALSDAPEPLQLEPPEPPEPISVHNALECGMLRQHRPTVDYWSLVGFNERQACSGGMEFCLRVGRARGILAQEKSITAADG